MMALPFFKTSAPIIPSTASASCAVRAVFTWVRANNINEILCLDHVPICSLFPLDSCVSISVAPAPAAFTSLSCAKR